MAPDAPWSDIAREMEGCFWSKPAVLKAVEKGTEALGHAIQEYRNTCHSAGITPDEELLKLAEQTKAKALVTLTEEYMASKIATPDAKTPAKLRKRLLDITEKFDIALVHPTIRKEVARLTTS